MHICSRDYVIQLKIRVIAIQYRMLYGERAYWWYSVLYMEIPHIWSRIGRQSTSPPMNMNPFTDDNGMQDVYRLQSISHEHGSV